MPVYDQVTGALERFAQDNIERIFVQAHRIARGSGTILGPFPQHATAVDPMSIREINARLLSSITAICRRSELFRLLILCRKVPCTVISGLLPEIGSPKTLSQAHQVVFVEGVLFATNCILQWAPNTRTVQSINARNFLNPSDHEMKEAILLMALSWLHRYNAFLLNGVARRNVVSREEFDTLIELYNRRQHTALSTGA